MAKIISADEIKKKLRNYSPERAEIFHRESTHQADKLFERTLKVTSHKEIILLSGGAASGKTEFLDTQLKNRHAVILDATLSTVEGAKIKIKKILKIKKKAVIYAVIPDDLRRAFVAFLNRDRKFSDIHFYKTHSGSRKTLLWVAKSYPKVEINIVESSYTLTQKLEFARIKFDNRSHLLKYLARLQMSEDDIISYVNFINE